MNSKKPVIVKRSNQSTQKTQRHFQPSQQSNMEPTSQLEIEQPEQPQAVVHLESLAETPLDALVYGTGWSVAELMDEFDGRYNG
jgi:hypothetical protein